MFVVESLSAEVRESGSFAGFPTTAIVEDTPTRWLLTEFPLPQGMWRHAIQTGVDGVLGDFGSFTVDEVESFARREGHIIAGEARIQLKTTNETPFVHLHAHSEYCLDPDTLVFQASSLKWVPISSVTEGEVLAGFGENLLPPDGERGNSRSKMERSTVIATNVRRRECYRITLEDGSEIISSAGHGWVVNGTTRGSQIEPGGPPSGSGSNTRRWLTTEEIAQSKRGYPRLIKWATPWGDVPEHLSYEAGYLAGILDGEGWLHNGQLSVAQRPTMVLEEIKRACDVLGYERTEDRLQGGSNGLSDCLTFRFAGYESALRLVSQIRPRRFVGRAGEIWEGRRAGGKNSRPVQIVNVEYLGERDTIALTTSTKTFVAAGFLSHNSPLDGLATITEMVERVAQQGQSAMAVTDHGVCAGHLELQSVARKVGIKPIFGIEANFIANAKDKNPELRGAYNHFILLAKNNVGLHNLWRASTMAQSPDRFYGRSRMDWELLEEYGEGLVASSACLRGPLSKMILDDDEQGTIEMIGRFKKIFGDDFYLELHLNQLEDQKKINEALVSLGQSTSTPLIVVGDSHYSCEEHSHAHTVWIAAQTNKDLQDEADLFSGHEEYHLHSVEDARRSLSYMDPSVVESAIAMTQTVADMCDASIDPRGSTPVYHRYEQRDQPVQGAELDALVLDEVCRAAMKDRFPEEIWGDAELKEKYLARYEEEMESLRGKGFCGYMLIVWDYCNWCREQGILMGPGRGSAAGSLVTYLLSITQPDPIPPGLLFERFISPGRTELPDIDSDFPKSKRTEVTNYLVERWGKDHVVRVGTVTRLRNKGVINDVSRVLKGSEHEVDFMDQKKITTLIDEAEASTAGLGLPWDELWDQEEEHLTPWKTKYPELFKYAEILVGRLKSYGKHPAGVVIDPQHSIIDSIPLRQGEDDHPVSEFPMDVLDELGLVKFDILTVRTLDTIQECMDLIEANPKYAGQTRHPHRWREEYSDPEVWDMICDGDTLGIFQLETPTCSRLSSRINPRSLADLCAILTLVRPGPMRSGLTDSFIRRRDGQEPVTFAHPLLRDVLGDTYGTMIYQEDIMATVKVIAGYDSAEADQVRKILGKKKVDKVAAEGERFISRSVEMGIDRQLAEHMFRQMEEFARYSFNKSHSWAYAMLAFWCAWYKCHFPAEFLVAALSTADKGRFPDFVMDAKRKGYRIEMPDINESGEMFTVTSDGLGIRYGLSSIKGLGNVAAQAAISERPYTSLLDFVERRPTKCNFGAIRLLSSIGVLDSLEPDHHRAQIDDFVEQMASGKLEQCAFMRTGTTPNQGVDVCCGFDWDNEPPVLGKSGKPLKAKPVPKKCTKACRQYVAAPSVHWKDVTPLTPKQIRQREAEVIGLYVSSTPFDGLDLTGLADYDVLTHGENGYHNTIAEIRSIRKLTDKSGRDMAFLSVLLPGGEASFTVFNSTFKELGEHLRPGTVGVFSVEKNSRGITVDRFIPAPPSL